MNLTVMSKTSFGDLETGLCIFKLVYFGYLRV